MVSKIKTLQGNEVFALDDSLRLGCGAEGAIFATPGNDTRAIKIYLSAPLDPDVENKLRVMIADPPEDRMRAKGHASIAWPEDLVVSCDTGLVCGFVMPRLRHGHAITRFLDRDLRRKTFPQLTYRSLCRLGSNLASAVWAIHEKGHVIGDVNDGNFMGTADSLVTVVDTDSFQITEKNSGHVYRCSVFTPFYTAPEFQSAKPQPLERTPAEDHFGIAVLIFQLLMEGYLPYACAFGDPSAAVDFVECLKRGYFPYAQQINGIKPPLWAPSFSSLHPTLRQLFIRCFVDGYHEPKKRPDAQTWRKALLDSESELVECQQNERHSYFNNLASCPWCEHIRRLNALSPGDWDPFPSSRTKSAPSSQSGTQRPISQRGTQPPSSHRPKAPSTPPVPPVFTASSLSVAPGDPITFQWSVPNAHTVQLKELPGRILSTTNSSLGVFTIWPSKSATYSLTATGMSVVLPPPLTISVAQPIPAELKENRIELNELIQLHSANIALFKTLPLRQLQTVLLSPMRMKAPMPLEGYEPLNEITIDLQGAPQSS